jgi:hypothetical protein
MAISSVATYPTTAKTGKAAARSTRTALDAQPIPKLSPRATNKTEHAKQNRLLNLSDAAVTVQWLNAAKEAPRAASYERVALIRQQLEELRTKRTKLKEFGPDPEEWDAACREMKEQRERVKARKPGHAVRFPGDRNRDTPEGEKQYLELNQQINMLADSLNESLSRYAFRPQVVYARLPGSITVLQNIWAGGMVPDNNKRWFQVKVNGSIISEADAALALVRLDLTGEMHKVRLCEKCKDRWLVAEKSNYRFCSGQCREAFYVSQPGYDERKAKNQSKYRANLKKMHAAQEAAFARKVRI